jgi:hypothetical protein
MIIKEKLKGRRQAESARGVEREERLLGSGNESLRSSQDIDY